MNRRKSGQIHILVVDDEKDIRDILQRTIKGEGYNCSIAGNVQEALKVLNDNNIDVVITDIVMPGASGIELVKVVKENHNADVMVMTGFAEGLKYEEIIEKGACDFVQKPIGTKELLVRLKRILRERAILAERNQAEAELKLSFKKLGRILDETVNALGSALGKRDLYTAGHQQRVANLACAIAKEMRLSENQIEGIRIAGLLHDIGKISVPAEILNKPGKLSKNEFNLIKEHPRIGYDIVKEIEFEQPIAQSILQHHERIDGSGYPQGILGENIILEARILAVVDVVEAMSSHRPYRPSLGIDKALDEISKNRSTFYDPDVVDMCIRSFKEKELVFV